MSTITLTVTISLDVPIEVAGRHPLALLLDADKAFDGWPTHDDVGRFACRTTSVAVAIEGQEVAASPQGSIEAVRALLEAEAPPPPPTDPEDGKTTEEMTAILKAWCLREDCDHICARIIISDPDITPEQTEWLGRFIARWDELERAEVAAAAAARKEGT